MTENPLEFSEINSKSYKIILNQLYAKSFSEQLLDQSFNEDL